MNQNVKLWLRAANPLKTPRGMAEAQRSARWASAVLIVQMIVSIAYLVWWAFNPDWFGLMLEPFYQEMGLPREEVDLMLAMLRAMTPILWIGSGLMSLVWAALAWVQWRHMTQMIPIILLVLAAYQLFSAFQVTVVGLWLQQEILRHPGGAGFTIAGWIIAMVLLPVEIAAYRGARALDTLKRAS